MYEGNQSRWETVGNGALSLDETNIILLTSPQDAFIENIDVNLRGDMFKVPVYLLLVFYVE